MAKRRIPAWLTGGVLIAVISALVGVPAIGATQGAAGPSAKVLQGMRHDAAAVAASAQGQGSEENEAQNLLAREAFQAAITSAPGVAAPAAGMAAAVKAAAALPTRGGSWKQVTDKPFIDDPLNRGYNYGVGWYYITGRMTALTASKGAVYAGSASGGVWRSTDKGIHWTPINAGLPRIAVGALATSPADGSIWVGLGEANTSFEAQNGLGIYRLAAGSDTWTRVGGTEIAGSEVYRIRWISGYVYAATTHGLWRRASGASASTAWELVLKPDPNPFNSPYRTSFITDVIEVPGSNGSKIFAPLGWRGAATTQANEYNGFYVGTGVKGSFHRVKPTGEINPNTIGRTTLSSSGGWLYAVVEDVTTVSLLGQGAYVSKSGNPAGPWNRIATPWKLYNSDSALGPPPGYFPGVQAWYNQYILADPNNREHVYLQLEEVYESTNGGQTWNTVGPYWNYDVNCNPKNETPYACPPTTHPDQHAGMILNGEFWAGNDGGVWRRPLGWHQKGHWTNLNKDLFTTQAYSAAVGKYGEGKLAYWAGLQDNGEALTFTGADRVYQAFTGDGGDTIVDPNNGARAVVEYVYLDMYLTQDGGHSYREISPSCLTATNPPKLCDPNPRFIAPIEMDVKNPDHWVAAGQYIWEDFKSWNTVCETGKGCDWKKVYDTGEGHATTALAVSGKTIYAAYCGPCDPKISGAFQRGMATNYGGTWHKLPIGELPDRYITSLAVDPANAAHVYASVGAYSKRWIDGAGYGHIFESTDGGKTWKDISGNLPDAPAYKVVVWGGQLVVGDEVGAFIADRSNPGHWANLGSDLPRVTVWDLAVTPNGDRIVAGTHGRGMWELTKP